MTKIITFFIIFILILLFLFQCTTPGSSSGGGGGGSSGDGKEVVYVSLSDILYRDIVSVTGVSNDSYTQTSSSQGSLDSFIHNISDFSIGKYEVTYELWYNVRIWAISKNYSFANGGKEGNDGIAGATPTTAKYEPVSTVNWRDAIVWCNAYSEMAGLIPVYYSNAGFTTPLKISTNDESVDDTLGSIDNPYVNWSANGYRLPTEGEWQFAASSRGVTPYNYASGSTASYSSFDATDEVAWFGNSTVYGTGNTTTTKNVGTKIPNQLGIYDMSGNIREWCWDFFGAIPSDPQADYKGPGFSTGRVRKGGCWYNSSRGFLQIGNHMNNASYYEDNGFGFRVARSN
jgi:formylglycine-generating enzyme required for sulfatase activity